MVYKLKVMWVMPLPFQAHYVQLPFKKHQFIFCVTAKVFRLFNLQDYGQGWDLTDCPCSAALY